MLAGLLANLSIQVLFDAAADAMLLVDAAGYVVEANASTLQMLGYAENEICGLKVEALMPNAYRDQHQQYRDKYVSKPEKRSMGKSKNLVALARDGRELPVDIGLSPILVEGMRFVLVTFHAIDKQILAETSLRVSEDWLHLAKLGLNVGTLDVDLKKNALVFDELIGEIWGIAPNEVISYQQFLEAIHPAYRLRRQVAIEGASAHNSNGEFHLEYCVTNRIDGSLRWVFAIEKVVLENGVAVRTRGMVQEITERKLLEQKLNLQRVESEALANQHIAIQTASAIAHELNQPLAAISAYSEVALHALENDAIDTDKLNRSLEGCVTQAQRAGQSLHELLQFLQKGEVAVDSINLNEIVHEALHIAQDSGYGGIHPSLDLEQNLPRVLGNHTQVQKVLVNLMRNGIEAANSINVPIVAIKVTVRTKVDFNMAHVTVQDNGPGLGSETVKRLFEPFFTTKPKGIGMGLAISRALIEANGGQLWFDSDASTGASFHFTLPFAP